MAPHRRNNVSYSFGGAFYEAEAMAAVVFGGVAWRFNGLGKLVRRNGRGWAHKATRRLGIWYGVGLLSMMMALMASYGRH